MNETGFTLLYIGNFLLVAVLFILPIVLIVGGILAVKKKNNEITLQIYEKAAALEAENKRLAEKELELKKMKYRRVKCAYCGTLNTLTAANCVSCGAVLEQKGEPLS